MSWGVYDFKTKEGESFPANGHRFHSYPGHRYLVTLRVEDVGIEKITLDGSGLFKAFTALDRSGHADPAPRPLPASIPHREFVNHGDAPSHHDLVVIMEPDIGAWAYERLSCGFHAWGISEPQEYFASEGTMTFTGTSLNIVGGESSATLTTTP